MPALTDLHHRHPNSTIYILCSGRSMHYIHPTFFTDRLTIAVNDLFYDFPSTYATGNYHDHVPAALAAGCLTVAPLHDCCLASHALLDPETRRHPNLYQFPHGENRYSQPFSPGDFTAPDRLCASASSACLALHLAYYLGATSIILCGMDGGLLDGQMNYPGYNRTTAGRPPFLGSPPNTTTWLGHPRMTAHLVLQLVDFLRGHGVHVHSLNPFINFTLEDHRFESLSEDLATTRSFLVPPTEVL